MTTLISYPVQKLINYSGFKSVCYIYILMILLTLLSVAVGFFSPDMSSLSMVFIELCVVFYLSISLFIILSHDLTLFNNLFGSLNAETFDYRDLEMSNLSAVSCLATLMSNYRELDRIKNKNKDRLNEVSYSAIQLIDTSHAVTKNVERQSDATNSTAAAINQMSVSLEEVNTRIEDVNDSSHQAFVMAEQGRGSIAELKSSLKQVAFEAHETTTDIERLMTLASSVAEISESIQGIAAQTNLLALNASIEAARAGDMGRGFAVVADEVRALAKRSHTAADSIVENLASVIDQGNKISRSMAKVVTQSSQCGEGADIVDQSLHKIEGATFEVKEKMRVVATNAEQQSIATNEIATHVESVVQGARDNADIAKQAEMVASHLKSLTQIA